jgi:hypothetical protein
MRSNLDISVSDPTVAGDPLLPWLPAALDPVVVAPLLIEALAQADQPRRLVELGAIRLTRHKPGRRCLIEYDVMVASTHGRTERLTLVGKMRAKGADTTTHNLHRALRASGFGDDSPDGMAVPAPLGVLPELGLWLQHKVPGRTVTNLLTKPTAGTLLQRIAAAAHKLHLAGVPARRTHTMTDELRILRERLEALAEQQPGWRGRLEEILAACHQLGASIAPVAPRDIHRDFYPDQVLVAGERLYLIDLDLYCAGDPSLDIGNFLGHMIEYALRVLGDPAALVAQETALLERFLMLNSTASQASIQAYATLTLARQIAISFRFPDRRHVTPALMALCERRLAQILMRPPAVLDSYDPRPAAHGSCCHQICRTIRPSSTVTGKVSTAGSSPGSTVTS